MGVFPQKALATPVGGFLRAAAYDAPRAGHRPDVGLRLQQTIGNQGVRQLLAAARAAHDFNQAADGTAAGIPYRKEMEASFGEDFSGVRAYFGRRDELDRLNANAASSGERVAFASSLPGKKTVAHELAHVVQQRRSGSSRTESTLSHPGEASEEEAENVSARAATGEPVNVSAAPTSAIHRDIKDKNLPVPLGHFEIDMTKYESKGFNAAEDGSISFYANEKAPDCKSIRFSQVGRVFDVDAKKEFDWLKDNPDDFGQKSTYNKIQTTAADQTAVTAKGDTLKTIAEKHYGDATRFGEIFAANKKALAATMKTADGDKALPENVSLTIPKAVLGGYFLDHATNRFKPRTAKKDPVVSQDYMLPSEYLKDVRQHGSKAGKTIVPAIMTDRPITAYHVIFTFETTARCDDTGVYYGTIHWSYDADADAGKVSNEKHHVTAGVSDTFRAAQSEFDKFYKNPPNNP